MEINEDKSMILNAGTSRTSVFENFKITLNLKYLGLDFIGRGRLWKSQREKIKSKPRGMIYNLRCIADHTLSKLRNVDMMWNSELLPATLYGMELITLTNEIVKEMEVMQGLCATHSQHIHVLIGTVTSKCTQRDTTDTTVVCIDSVVCQYRNAHNSINFFSIYH